MRQFIRIDNRILNIDYIHSVTLNKDGKQGWVKFIDEDNKFGEYRVSPEMFEYISEILVNQETLKEENEKETK